MSTIHKKQQIDIDHVVCPFSFLEEKNYLLVDDV